jgi:uncharacterized membrane protein YfcA
MTYLFVAVVALVASGLTLYSGFGLGTLLLPAFALFMPVEQAVAMTAVVHFLNSLFKLALVGRRADWKVVLRFGLPAIIASLLGAWVLTLLSGADSPPRGPSAVKVVIGVVLLVFAVAELVPYLRKLEFGPKWMPLGGVLSGFFGGLAGMQGAVRSAFLARAGLTPQAFVATGVVIACLIDVSRLGVYSQRLFAVRESLDYWLLAVAVLAAFAGVLLGTWFLKKLTVNALRTVVGVLLCVVAVGLIAGVL